jgi:rubrerythrin
MKLEDTIRSAFLRRLVSTPRGRAHVLNLAAEAEDSDEAAIFDQLLSKVDDPELQKMIRIHRDDETRHGAMFRACVERTGVDPGPVPEQLKLIDRINEKLGGFFEQGIQDERHVMEAYALLFVVEQRAIEQFPAMEAAFRRHDPETADTFAAIARDEERHLKYCKAIGKRYAADEKEWLRAVRKYRAVESEAFAENSRANIEYAIETGVLRLRPLERLALRAVNALASLRARHAEPHQRRAPAAAGAR